jgi:hypothetical protein
MRNPLKPTSLSRQVTQTKRLSYQAKCANNSSRTGVSYSGKFRYVMWWREQVGILYGLDLWTIGFKGFRCSRGTNQLT